MNRDILIVIGVIAIALVGGVYFGFVDLSFLGGNDAPDLIEDAEPVPEFDKFEIWGLLCQLSDKDLDRDTTYEYIDRLNMEVFGSQQSYVDIYGEYSLYYENNGWTITVREFPSYPDGDGAIIGYSKGTQGASVMTASTTYIENVYGYNTMTLTSTGLLSDYTSFYNFVDSS